jgi:hypothetical protein
LSEHVVWEWVSPKFDGSTSISQFFPVKMTIWIVYLKFSDTTRQRNICDQCRNWLFRRQILALRPQPTNHVTRGLPPPWDWWTPPIRFIRSKPLAREQGWDGISGSGGHPGVMEDGIWWNLMESDLARAQLVGELVSLSYIHLPTDLGCCMPRRFWAKV